MPAVALVPPDKDAGQGRRPTQIGFAAIGGALADWDDVDEVVGEIYAGRRKAKDRPAPDPRRESVIAAIRSIEHHPPPPRRQPV